MTSVTTLSLHAAGRVRTVYNILQTKLGDLEQFARYVVEFLEKGSEKEE